MRPVLTAAEMRAVDEAALQHVAIEELISRAGNAIARTALEMLGGSYGRRVVVVAGKGHNGDDGRTAARLLRRRGVVVSLLAVDEAPAQLPSCDLVIDAAFGTGFRGEYAAPRPPPGAKVLAVDMPSGVQADTGIAGEHAVRATETVTFGALKPGLLLAAGRERAGLVRVDPIGLPVSGARCHEIEDADMLALPRRGHDAHKWQTACYIVAGSPGMTGAAALAARGAGRAGAGMVRLGSPGAEPGSVPFLEAVARPLPMAGWDEPVLEEVERCRALVVGPGLGQKPGTVEAIRRVVAASSLPLVLDADGLNALGPVHDCDALRKRRAPLVLTPHDGEFARLAGVPPGEDRLASVRTLAERAGAVVLLKGSTTIVADPSGEVLLAATGSPRLATAGTGDVLSGIIGAFLARGLEPLFAAALAAFVHGRAASLGPSEGLLAGDLPDLVSEVLSAAGPGGSSGPAPLHPSLAGD